MPTKEKYLAMDFPLKGLDLNDEFEEQPPGTTAVGNNVRAREILQQRVRGGSRPGLVKYIPQQIPEGTTLIQHLDVIVDPSEAALTQVFTVPDATWVEDPTIPGLFYPPGGGGWQPNPNATKPPRPPTSMTINVLLTEHLGGEPLTSVTVTWIEIPDARTGSTSYSFTGWDGVTPPTCGIECDNNLGVYYPFEAFLNGVSQGTGSSGNNLTVTVPFVPGGTASVEFVIAFG